MTRTDIINDFISKRGYTSFLEIGTASGDNYRNVSAPIRMSVDPDPHTMATFRMTSDTFFHSYGYTFDIIFIDGLHECNQVYRDIHNALNFLNPGGVIILHDCLPSSEQMQTHADSYPGGVWTGDVWKAFLKARSELSFLTYTINTDYGCGIIDTTVKLKRKPPHLPTDMDTMTYNEFVTNKTEWMNVKEGIIYAE